MSKANDYIEQLRKPIDGLVGWREATENEYDVIKGLFLTEAKSGKKSDIIVNSVFGMTIFLCIYGIATIFTYFPIAFANEDIMSICILSMICAALAFLAYFLTKTLIAELKYDGSNRYMNAILKKDLRVCDVVITDIKSHYGIGNGLGSHSAHVKDKVGNEVTDSIPLRCFNNYQKTDAILIEIYLSREGLGRTQKWIIPCEQYDPKLWEIAFKRLSYMKKP